MSSKWRRPKRKSPMRKVAVSRVKRPVIITRTLGELLIDAVAAEVLDEMGIKFDVMYFRRFDDNPLSKRLYCSPALASVRGIPNHTGRLVNKLKKMSGTDDVRSDTKRALRAGRKLTLKNAAQELSIIKNAPFVWSVYCPDVFAFVQGVEHKTIYWNLLNFVQVPVVSRRDDGFVDSVARCVLIDVGRLFGGSKLARDANHVTEAIESDTEGEECRIEDGKEIARQLKNNTYGPTVIPAPVSKCWVDHGGGRKPWSIDWDAGAAVFAPMHCNWDAQLMIHSPLYGTNLSFLKDLVNAVPDNFRVLVKMHPHTYYNDVIKHDPVEEFVLKHPKCIMVSNDVHNIIPTVKGVVTINSSVGLEAFAHYKPVVVCGHAFYAHVRGVSKAAYGSREEFKEAVKELCLGSGEVDQRWCNLALHHFWRRWMTPREPKKDMKKRMRALFSMFV